MSGALPPCGFKEWSLVCDALSAGAQSIILRKGGIHEGRKGFWWQHDRFFLFPTFFHEQDQNFLRVPEGGHMDAPPGPDVPHVIQCFAEVDWKGMITDWDRVAALHGLHYWSEPAVKERFDYTEQQGISLALVRVHQLSRPWSFPDEPKYGGCRSWLNLPPVPEDISLTPVLSDAAHAAVRAELFAKLELTADAS